MNLNIDITPEVKGTAKSIFTVEKINARLEVLRQRDDDKAREEIEYLEKLLKR